MAAGSLCWIQVKVAEDILSKGSLASQTPVLCQIPAAIKLVRSTSALPADTWSPVFIPQWQMLTTAGISLASKIIVTSLVAQLHQSHVDGLRCANSRAGTARKNAGEVNQQIHRSS